MKKIAYPGTFDPFHKGHEKIVEKLSTIFDEVYILVFDNNNKNVTINKEIRTEAIKKIFSDYPNVFVKYSNQSLVDELQDNEIKVIGRGIRNSEDVVVEMQRATMISKLDSVQTIFVPTDPEVGFISSSIIRELISLNKDFSKFVSNEIYILY